KFRYRCQNERECTARFEKLKLVSNWKGSLDEREGRVIMRREALVVEELDGKIAVEYQVRCLQCDRRGSFFVQRWKLERTHPRMLAKAMEIYIIGKIMEIEGMGCPHVKSGEGVGDMIGRAYSA